MREGGTWRRPVKLGGVLLTLAALAFLAWSVRRHWAALSGFDITPGLVVLVPAVSAAYGVAMFLIAQSWHWVLTGLSDQKLPHRLTWASYGMTQVAKYLPGNVLHYVGRHLWLSRAGVPNRIAIMAAVWEAALMCAGAAVCAALALMLSPDALPSLPLLPALDEVGRVGAPLMLALAAGGFLGITAVRRLVPRLTPLVPAIRPLLLSSTAILFFFVSQGGVLVALQLGLGGPFQIITVAIASISWICGYLTPGAPGGIGTREAVMVTLATPFIGGANALILAALFRIVSVLGDLTCFALCSLLVGRATSIGDVAAGAATEPQGL